MRRGPQSILHRATRPRPRPWIAGATLACLLLAAGPVRASEPGSGLVVEGVAPDTAAALSGFKPGDLLLTWTFRPRDPIEGRPQTGTLDTPFDLSDLFIEMAPRGELILEGSRQGRALSWTLRSTGSLAHGLEVRPVMELDPWERYRRGLHKICAAVPGKEPSSPASLVCEAVPTAWPRRAAWDRLRYAVAAGSAGAREAADQAFEEASEILLQASDPSAQASVLGAWADQLYGRRETARAREILGQALALERRRDGAGLSVAATLGFLAWLYDQEGDLASAERTGLERLAILEQLAPEGLEIARTLELLGRLALWRGDTTTAAERLNRSEAIQRPIAATTFVYAATLSNLGILALELGELDRAEALQRQALALIEQLLPGSRDQGGSLMNLAETLILRGELAAAEDLLRQSAELIDKPGEDPQAPAFPQANLGWLALYRGDLAAAQSYFELALGRLREGPEGVELADTYSALAEVARRQRRFAEARTWEKSALAITEHLALGSLGRAARLQALARIELEGGGDLAAAEALLRQAQAAALEAASENLPLDSIRRDLGRLLVRKGRLAEAEALYRQALSDLDRRGLTGTSYQAEIRNLLGHA
jgi:tetratricopeptide (TPR) repeat protein